MADVPILMPTAPRYLPLAEWTCGQIRRFWTDAPRVYLCGAEAADALPLRNDPSNWMAVVRSACEDLLQAGFRQAYVILDDHPPIAKVHSAVMAKDLPALAWELGATSFVTGGYGPLNRRRGVVVERGGFSPERLDLAEQWKLPLHPALWNLERLHGILVHLVGHLPLEQQNPWAFERIGSDPVKGGVNPEWLSACWRVNAWEMSSPEARQLHGNRDRAMRLAARVLTALSGRLEGEAAKQTVGNALGGIGHPRIGPYPCFWSGVMKKGRLNTDYLFYANLKGRSDLVQGLEQAFAKVREHRQP